MDDLAGKTISAADFILALKRYRDEVGVPATTKPVLRIPLAGKNEKSAQRLDNVVAKTQKLESMTPLSEAGTLPPSLPAKRERTTKEKKQDAKKDQQCLFT